MRKYFTHYWLNSTFEEYQKSGKEGEPLDHAAGKMFLKRGIKPGHHVYVVTVVKGILYIVGKIEVKKICEVNEAAAYLGTDPANLWKADEHIVAALCTPQFYNCKIPYAVAQQLRFHGSSGEVPPKFRDNQLNEQTLRTVRELTEKSASLLDTFLPSLQTFIPRQKR